MKKTIIIAVLLGIVSLLIYLLINQKKEINKQKNNLKIEFKQELSKQQGITKKQFKESFEKEVELLKSYNIKPAQVESYIKIKYNFIDTLILRDTLVFVYDTVKSYNIAHFDVESPCNRIKGSVFENNIEIESVETNDSISISLYKEKRKCLFKKREIRVIAISKCKGDTLAILRNLKIL